jgi:DNA-binding NarL/FixJ family response regulator
MFREVLRELIQRQADMDAVGEVLDPDELPLAIDNTPADVVVVALSDSDEEPGICRHLLAKYPRLLILALSHERERAFVYRQGVPREQISEVSDQAILAAIRTVKGE